MLKSTLRQKPDLFEDAALHWHRLTGGQLLIFSPQGDPLVRGGDRTLSHPWPDLLKKASFHQLTALTQAEDQVLIVPLVYDDQLLGYLASLDLKGQSLCEQQFELLIWLADSLVARVVDLYAMQGMTDELIGAWNQLELIYRVTENLTLTADLTTVLHSVLREIQKVAHTEEGFIILEQLDTLLCVTTAERYEQPLRYSLFLENLERAKRVVVCQDRVNCLRFWPKAPADVENMIAARLPEEKGTDISAAIGLINKTRQNFTAGDVKLLSTLAQQVAIIINSHLTHYRLLGEERLRRELEIAAEIQGSLLPATLPQVRGFSMVASSIPASEVGGDFYDFINIDDRRLALVIGDVSGKGVPAAMLTSLTRAMLRLEALRGEPPHRIIQQANEVLYQDLSRTDLFVTVLVAVLDTYENKLTYASAGHTPALLWRAKTRLVEQLRATSVPLGISVGIPAEAGSKEIELCAGDMLILYTDGVTEAQSPANELFGLDQLTQSLKARAADSPEQLQQYIYDKINHFRQHAPWQDDMTLIIVKALRHSANPVPADSTVIRQIDFLYPADMDHLSAISQQIAGTCRQLSALPDGSSGEDFIHLIELAISEICTNIVKHAYAQHEGKISGQVTLLNNGVQLDFFDQGVGFDPNKVPIPQADPHNLKEGGYGLHIVRQIMDIVAYETTPERGNHWHLVKFLPGESHEK